VAEKRRTEDDGIIVKRKSNPKEATIEAWGLVDGQPTSKHFSLRVYDDVVTLASVTTPDMIKKTTEAWELADNLGTKDGHERYIGTRYHYNDTYRDMMTRQVVDVRKHAITHEGTAEGNPVMLTRKQVAEKRRKQGPYTFACQQLLEPMADESQGFKEDWIHYYDDVKHYGMNVYILVDPAGEKKKGSDYTSMPVIGLAHDLNYYLIDWVYDKLNLTERAAKLIELHRNYRPKAVGYEKYGKDSDIEHIKTAQNSENYRFSIIELGGRLAKNDRIKRLVPTFEQGRFYLPRTMHRTNYEGRTEDLIQKFIHEEYKPFPVAVHDDGLDSWSRIHDPDLNAKFPGGAFGNQYDDWSVAVNS
jgi:predicted phage terminase large subunit-like protein